MEEDTIKKHQKSVHKIYLKTLWPRLEEPFGHFSSWLLQYEELSLQFLNNARKISASGDSIRLLQEHYVYRKKVLAGLESWMKRPQQHDYKSFIPEFDSSFAAWIENCPRHWFFEQAPERFLPQKDDSRTIRIVKAIKRAGFAIGDSPRRVVNFFRVLVKKQTHPVAPWNQKAPARKLSLWYYENHFLAGFIKLDYEARLRSSRLARQLWQLDDQMYAFVKTLAFQKVDAGSYDVFRQDVFQAGMSELKKLLEQHRQEITDKAEAQIRESDQQFVGQVMLGGTLEFSSLQHSERKRRKQRKKLRKQYAQKRNERENTLFALADDWRFNQEIYLLVTQSLKAGLQFHMRLHSRAKTVKTGMLKLIPFLEKVKEDITEDAPEEIRKNLRQLIIRSTRTLQSGIIPEILDLLLEQNFPMIIDEAEQTLLNELKNMAAKRILIPGFSPEKDYSSRSLQEVTPAEIIDFEMAGEVKRTLLHSKTDTLESMEQFKQELENLGRMVVFNLDSGVAMLDEQEIENTTTCVATARESMERAVQNAQEIINSFNAFTGGLQEEIQAATEMFSGSLRELTDNRNVEQIRYRIAKARALKTSEQFLQWSSERAGQLWHRNRVYYRLARKKAEARLKSIRGQLGMQVNAGDISGEISEFLITSDMNLPFVYKRLFVNEPLKETTFYFQRRQEKQLLKSALEKWKAGVFTPVLIYGEKGSGVSTFVHMFVKENIQRRPVVFSVMPPKRILSEEDLLALLGLSFRGEAFGKVNEFYDYVEKQEPFVVFVDKLHMMYVRNTGGFSTLKKFFELISNTSKTIFWICTCGLYASMYLDKAIGLHSYFPALILMQNLSMAEVKEVIMLRHKASGYELRFLPSAQDLENRKFTNKGPSQQQHYLKEKYFQSLNRLTRSNIAFALHLWLRSTHKAEQTHIYINSLDKLDFSFMLNLPHEVVFGLHALILHEYLDVHMLSQVLNISRRQAYLMLMRLADRGIIMEEKGSYFIHPLLYRQTILLLQYKNLLH